MLNNDLRYVHLLFMLSFFLSWLGFALGEYKCEFVFAGFFVNTSCFTSILHEYVLRVKLPYNPVFPSVETVGCLVALYGKTVANVPMFGLVGWFVELTLFWKLTPVFKFSNLFILVYLYFYSPIQ